jgi:hypothetical protein
MWEHHLLKLPVTYEACSEHSGSRKGNWMIQLCDVGVAEGTVASGPYLEGVPAWAGAAIITFDARTCQRQLMMSNILRSDLNV